MFSLFGTIRTHRLLLVLISVFPASAIMIYSGFHVRSHAVVMAKALSEAMAVLSVFIVKKAEELHSMSIFLPRRRSLPRGQEYQIRY